MIHPRNQWCIQIEGNRVCNRACSNCTRLIGHGKGWFMPLDVFEKCVEAVKDFPLQKQPESQGRRRVVGLMGGEVLLHPEFPSLVEIMCRHVPDPIHRGLWTGLDWLHYKHPRYGEARSHVFKLLGEHPGGGVWLYDHRNSGYLNLNAHGDEFPANEFGIRPCDENSGGVDHQPVLVASKDVIKDEKQRWEMIEKCWVQQTWSSSFTAKGFYFCEVAAVLDEVLNDGKLAIPISEKAWRHDLWFEPDENGVPRPFGEYAEQIRNLCEKCGACLKLKGRRDAEEVDDISPSNLKILEQKGSTRIKRGRYMLHDDYEEVDGNWVPYRYVKPRRE